MNNQSTQQLVAAAQKRIRQTTITTPVDGISQEFQIQIFVLPAREGLRMATKLLTLFAPMLSGGEGEQEVDFSQIAKVLASSDQVDLIEITDRLLKGLSVNGQGIDLDEYFAANYGILLQIMAFALMENFGSFLDGIGTLNGE